MFLDCVSHTLVWFKPFFNLRLIKLLCLFLLLFGSGCKTHYSNGPKQITSITLLDGKYSCNTIEEAITHYESGNFNVPLGNSIYHKVDKDKYTWLHFKVNRPNDIYYITFWYHFIEYAQLYVVTEGKVSKLQQVGRANDAFVFKNINFRVPSWQVKITNDQTDLFFKIRNDSSNISIVILCQTLNEFLQYAETDSVINGFFITLLILLILIIIIIFISERRFGLLWYGAAIGLFILEFLAYKGIGIKYFWHDSPFLTMNMRTIAHILLIICLCLFFIKFYNLNKAKFSIYGMLRLIVLINGTILTVFIVAYFCNCLPYDFRYWFTPILRLEVLAILIMHFVLLRQRRIPAYLAIAFSAPLVFTFLQVYYNPNYSNAILNYFLLENMVYIGVAIELTAVCFFIIDNIVQDKKLAVVLKEENLTLRTNIQSKIFSAQEKERDKLLGNVHDSFGGYIEALKLRLLNATNHDSNKLQELLDSFYQDYRYLLNSLYTPKIDSENFIENLTSFFENLNQVTNGSIKYKFDLQGAKLDTEKCLHVYRIISELTTNALKHSKASMINIEMKKLSHNNIQLTISDNGIGFDADKAKSDSYGLKNIEKRVKAMNGKFRITSTKNIGTRTVIDISEND